MKERTKQIAKNALRIASGGLVGTLDVMTTGLPLATLLIPITDVGRIDDCAKRSEIDKSPLLKEYAKSLVPYFVGTAVPFCIRYSEQIDRIIKELF